MNMEKVVETLTYVKQFSSCKILIKVGGAILNDRIFLQQLCGDLSLLHGVGISIVLVHGGGKAINAALEQYNIPSNFQEGLRVTSSDAMNVIEGVMAGQVNKLLVRALNAVGIEAIGVSGVDNQLLLCEEVSAELGRVGKITAVNATVLQQLLQTQGCAKSGIIPVIAPIGVDSDGNSYNVNADWAACHIARALGIKKVIYLTDQDGIFDREGKVLPTLDLTQMQKLKENSVVQGGMLSKINAIMASLNAGVEQVHVLNGKVKNSLIEELFTSRGIGTFCFHTMNP